LRFPDWVGPVAAEGVVLALSILLNKPLAWGLLVISTFLFAVWLAPRAKDWLAGPPKPAGALATEIEQYMGEGIELLKTISDPSIPKNPGTLGPDTEAMMKAASYFDRARQLLIDGGRPSLLPDLAAKTNEVRRHRQEGRDKETEQLNRRAQAGEKVGVEQMDRFIDETRQRAMALVEGTLEGLAAVTKDLGA
jgi:hypothetical protein